MNFKYLADVLVGLCLFLSLLSRVDSVKVKLDLKQTDIYGPGLFPDKVVFPVRHFFIEAYDTNGKRIRKSVGDVFKVQVEGESSSGTYCRVWSQVLNRYDGSYIVRYRTYQTCRETSIHILYKHQHVGKSPYNIKGPIYAEDCYCPVGDVNTWTTVAECPTEYQQITDDLTLFDEVDFDSVIEVAKHRFNQTGARSFCNYVVKDNKIYRECYGQHIGFNMFMDNILHSLARKMILPDIEFIVNLGDWPLVDPKVSPLLPIFSWCGSDDTADIVMPTYEITEGTLEMMGRVMLDILSVQSNNDIPWSNKKDKLFWRGRDSRRERLDLIKLARKHPTYFNASLTNFFFFKDEEAEYGPKEKHVSFFKFFDYKYQLNIDGTVASYRLPYLLAGSGVVFKQDSPYYEYFYRQMQPNVHYLPFKRDLSDLVEKIEWAREHDEEMKKIGDAGRKFAQNNLMPNDIYCYHALLFQEWSKRLVSSVKVRPGMEYIETPQNEKRFGDCKCHRLSRHDEL